MGKMKTTWLVVVTLLLATAAFGAEGVEQAKVHFKRGTELYDEGNYRAALVEFRRAHELSPNFKLLFNIGQVYMQLQDYAQALSNFQRYLKEGGSDVPAARRDEVGKEIDKLAPRIGKLQIDTAKGNEVLVDDESVGFAPLPAPVSVNTGRHRVTVGSQTRVVDVPGQTTVTVVLAQEQAPAPAAVVQAAPAAPATRLRAVPLVLWAGAGLLGVGWAVTGAMALGRAGDLATQRTTVGTSRATLNATSAQVSTFAAISDILGAAGLITAGFAIWQSIVGFSEPVPATALLITPWGVSASAQF